jgi:hypothetical protein
MPILKSVQIAVFLSRSFKDANTCNYIIINEIKGFALYVNTSFVGFAIRLGVFMIRILEVNIIKLGFYNCTMYKQDKEK